MSSLRRVFAMADAVISAAIKARAAVIRQPRVFIGFFEWLAWGILTESEVHMIFGEHVVKLKLRIRPIVGSGTFSDSPGGRREMGRESLQVRRQNRRGSTRHQPLRHRA